VRAVCAIVLDIDLSLDGFVAAESSRPDSGYTFRNDVEERA
jgi:hypothetical protein